MQEKNGIGPELSTGMSAQGQKGTACGFQVASEDPHSSPAFLEILRTCPVVFDGRLKCGPHDSGLESVSENYCYQGQTIRPKQVIEWHLPLGSSTHSPPGSTEDRDIASIYQGTQADQRKDRVCPASSHPPGSHKHPLEMTHVGWHWVRHLKVLPETLLHSCSLLSFLEHIYYLIF